MVNAPQLTVLMFIFLTQLVLVRLKGLGKSSLLVDKEARLGGKLIHLTRTYADILTASLQVSFSARSRMGKPASLPALPTKRKSYDTTLLYLLTKRTLSVAYLHSIRQTRQLVRNLHRRSIAQRLRTSSAAITD